MSLPFARANETFKVVLGMLVAVFLLVMILLNVLLNMIVISPIKHMSAQANEISMGALDVAELEVKGKDEIATLGQSFNRMHRSLANAMTMLDDMERQGP
jgi:protein-histidine pros-kinase